MIIWKAFQGVDISLRSVTVRTSMGEELTKELYVEKSCKYCVQPPGLTKFNMEKILCVVILQMTNFGEEVVSSARTYVLHLLHT